MTSRTITNTILAIRGDRAYALYGPDPVEGTAVSVPIIATAGEATNEAEERAASQALAELEAKVGFKLAWAWIPKKS
jgi:hypothetical protein